MANEGIQIHLYVPGVKRVISADVMFKTLAKALGDGVFEQGHYDIFQDSAGSVFINNELVYTPKERPK